MKNETFISIFLVAAYFMTVLMLEVSEHSLEVAKDQLNVCSADLHVAQSDLRAEMEISKAFEANARFEDAAFQGAIEDLKALQELHQEAMQWGPLRTPRDCVREVLLMEHDHYPVNSEAERAFLLKENEWLRNERERLYTDLDACEDFAFPKTFDSLGHEDWAPHDNSSSIYPDDSILDEN